MADTRLKPAAKWWRRWRQLVSIVQVGPQVLVCTYTIPSVKSLQWADTASVKSPQCAEVANEKSLQRAWSKAICAMVPILHGVFQTEPKLVTTVTTVPRETPHTVPESCQELSTLKRTSGNRIFR